VIKPPSNVKPYSDHFSEDPAFEQLPENATPEQSAEYATKVQVAIETGNWSGLRVDGASEPTTFTMKPLSSAHLGKLADMRNSGAGENAWLEYAFRCALVSVSNLGDAKVTLADGEDFGRIASLAWMETAGVTGSLGLRIIRELGGRALGRALALGKG
jgi:hypothetical protein